MQVTAVAVTCMAPVVLRVAASCVMLPLRLSKVSRCPVTLQDMASRGPVEVQSRSRRGPAEVRGSASSALRAQRRRSSAALWSLMTNQHR